MTASDMGAISPAEHRIRDILSRPEIGPQARLAALREAGLVPPADGYEVRTLDAADVEMIPIPHVPHVPVVPLAAPLVHLDPNTPVKTVYKAGRSWIQATDCTFSTKGNPSYIRLPSEPKYDPDLLIFFDDRPVDQKCIATSTCGCTGELFQFGQRTNYIRRPNLYVTCPMRSPAAHEPG
jgi:hypothetical protein